MVKHLYLVRHGRTLFNAKDMIQGRCDSPLVEEGREQAKRAGEYLQRTGIEFDHAYASPAGRAVETMECLNAAGGTLVETFETDPDLLEWAFGILEGESNYIVPERPWGNKLVPYGGESQGEVLARMYYALGDIMSRPGHECVLVVSHGSITGVFLHDIETAPGLVLDAEPGNCDIAHISFEDTGDNPRFVLQEILRQSEM